MGDAGERDAGLCFFDDVVDNFFQIAGFLENFELAICAGAKLAAVLAVHLCVPNIDKSRLEMKAAEAEPAS